MNTAVTCGICGHDRLRSNCHIIKLTLEERRAMEAQGQEPQNEYVYCRPCWRTLSNPMTGPTLGRGLIEARLRQLGVANAEQVAAKYHAKLVARIAAAANKPKPS